MKPAALIVTLMAAVPASAQDLPVLVSNVGRISIQDGEKAKPNGWRLSAEANPDVYRAELIDGRPHVVSFISDVDTISFRVALDEEIDFIVEFDGTPHYTRIVGIRFVPAARFDSAYQRERRGKIFAEIPEVYEMVNVAIALTPQARRLIATGTDYHRDMLDHFGPYRDHPFVVALSKELEADAQRYWPLKTDAYAFVFDGAKIEGSPVFDRVSQKENSLRPYLRQMQAFADDTDFRTFFREHESVYASQVSFFYEGLDIAGMLEWLKTHFPRSNDYDTYNLVFSPLVRGNQSAHWFESNGFKELQPHVEYPYRTLDGLSEEAQLVFRQKIVFTEMNHGFLNPETARYTRRVAAAISNRDAWVDANRGPGYYSGPVNLFDEYMNWVLVNLRATDVVEDAVDQQKIISWVDSIMVHNRGFPKFGEFSRFLVAEYRARESGTTVADMYPRIIAWFEERNGEAGRL